MHGRYFHPAKQGAQFFQGRPKKKESKMCKFTVKMLPISGLLLLFVLSACDQIQNIVIDISRPSSDAVQQPNGDDGETVLRGCKYDFDATVRSGPSEGLALVGTLAVVTVAPGVLRGYLYPNDDGEAFRVYGAVDKNMGIDLRFELTDGRVIVGTGIVEAPIDECRGTMDGTFIGPEKEDEGDWAGFTFDEVLIALGASADAVELRADDGFEGDPFFDVFDPAEFLVVITDPDDLLGLAPELPEHPDDLGDPNDPVDPDLVL